VISSKPEIWFACQFGDCAWITGNPEVISSPVGLVPTNALLFTYAHGPHALGVRSGFPEPTRLAPEYWTEKNDLELESPLLSRSYYRTNSSALTQCYP
jgi:hypothetical protein